VRGIIGELDDDRGIVIVDMEAGLELFGRGTPRASDLLLTVVEPSLWSIETATRVVELARELGIPKLAAIANKVREEADLEWIREALQLHGVEVIGVVPYDPAVSLADRRVRSLLDIAGESEAAHAIAAVADWIEAGAPLKVPAPVGGPAIEDNGCPWVVDK